MQIPLSTEELAALQLFKSHKVVRAGKIASIAQYINEHGTIGIELEGGGLIQVPPAWCHRHKPQAGGYFVSYEDGYCSFSPAEPFEGGYTAVKASDAPPENGKNA